VETSEQCPVADPDKWRRRWNRNRHLHCRRESLFKCAFSGTVGRRCASRCRSRRSRFRPPPLAAAAKAASSSLQRIVPGSWGRDSLVRPALFEINGASHAEARRLRRVPGTLTDRILDCGHLGLSGNSLDFRVLVRAQLCNSQPANGDWAPSLEHRRSQYGRARWDARLFNRQERP
jgi:hypothetical protein